MFLKRSTKMILVITLLSTAILTGCATSAPAAESTGTGVVTESTLTDTVDSSGSLQAAQIATLTWNTSGVVSSVNVSAGDKVKSDEVLLELDATTVPASVIDGFVALANAKLALEDAKSMSSTAEAAVALADAQAAYEDAYSDAYMIGNQVGSKNSVEAARVALEIAEVTLENATENYTDLSYLKDDNLKKLQSESAMINAQINVNTLKSQLNYLMSTPDTLTADTYTANLELAKAQLESAQRAYDRVKDGPNADDIAAAQAAVDAAQATVNSMKIIAPFDGEVVVLYDQTGDQVEAGENSVILVDREKMFVEVSIDETSISNVNAGDKAVISFDAFPGLDTTGEVTFINPIGSSSTGVVNYTVRVDLDSADPSILIGATASITIQTGDPQTILFVPISAVQSDAQGEYVIRVTNNSQERVNVVSGQIVDKTVVVKGDLNAGDIVQLFTST
ncbi:MAG TPA: hypothetical protein DD636_01210, partial [Anaerolineaceae bacterium]|nr:hypothetical protein [Anaerolineaceae bacterium]